jgi:hypothetical protein
MGLTLPKWYMARFKSHQNFLQKDNSEVDLPVLDNATSEPRRSDLQEPGMHESTSELSHPVVRKTHSKRLSGREEKKRLEALQKRREKLPRGPPFANKKLDRRSLGYEYKKAVEPATSDEDYEALDAARARLDDMYNDEEGSEDYDVEDAVLEDDDSEQAHLGVQDADRTGLETSATHQESVESTAAEFTTTSWRQLILESGDSSVKSKRAERNKSATSPATDFNSAIGALMFESDDSPVEHELVGKSEWPARHGWFPQHCQATLDALSIKSHTTKEVAACEPDRLLITSTIDDITLPRLPPTTKEVAIYEPERLRVIVAPGEPDRMMVAL